MESTSETEDRVDENLVLRWFCRLYWAAVPNETTLLRWASTLLPKTLHAKSDRVVQLARQAHVTTGRKLRWTQPVCKRLSIIPPTATIHHPTDSGLLVDGVRVLSRFIQRFGALMKDQFSNVQQTCRSRIRSARQAAQTLHRQLWGKGEEKEAQQKELYQKLLQTAEQMVRQSQQVVAALREQTQQQAKLLLREAQQVLPLVERVITQTRTRVLEDKKVASFESANKISDYTVTRFMDRFIPITQLST